jgi:hypothetical protein
VAENNTERIFCLRKLLELNPQNERARQGLRALGVDPEVTAAADAAPAIGVPILDDLKYARLQQEADDFLRRYNPQPIDRLDVQWARKQKKRYAETGERRMRQIIVAAAALVVVVVVGGIVLLASQVDLPIGGDEVAAGATWTPSATATATMTPTPGGATPTPFPNPMNVPATRLPTGLPQQGSAYGLKTPTAIYPDTEASVRRLLEEPLDYFAIGDYTTAAELLQAERESSSGHCYAPIVYFQALSLAELGKYREATALVQEAQTFAPQRTFTSCQGSPLLPAALGYIAYLQGNLQEALDRSAEALSIDGKIAQASITKARVEVARGEVQQAWQTINIAMQASPQDTNLLLMMTEIELANNQPASALGYVGQTLRIEEALLPGLYLQAETYLRLAGQSPTGSAQRLEYYGLAVISAQKLLEYYSGDPAGYLYLAKARLGEGNDDLAETALNRIIGVADSLPTGKSAVVREALLIRGNLYYRQGRLAEASADLEKAVYDVSGTLDPDVAGTLVDIAFRLGEFSDAENWIGQLRLADPANETYQLLEAKALVEVCAFYPDTLNCQHREMLNALTDLFIAALETEDQRAEAYSYRGQAGYWDTQRRGLSLSEGERQLAYQLALNDLTQALTVRESVVDHYYRGLILEELNDPLRAYEEYQWVDYWGDVYPYPFKNEDFNDRYAALAREAQDLIEAAAATPTPTPGPEPTETPRATPTPRSTATGAPTATPTATFTPTRTPTPTPIPPAEIP